MKDMINLFEFTKDHRMVIINLLLTVVCRLEISVVAKVAGLLMLCIKCVYISMRR